MNLKNCVRADAANLTVIFFKTGTITEGRPRVTQIVSVDSTEEAEIVRIAAAIDTHSDHP